MVWTSDRTISTTIHVHTYIHTYVTYLIPDGVFQISLDLNKGAVLYNKLLYLAAEVRVVSAVTSHGVPPLHLHEGTGEVGLHQPR